MFLFVDFFFNLMWFFFLGRTEMRKADFNWKLGGFFEFNFLIFFLRDSEFSAIFFWPISFIKLNGPNFSFPFLLTLVHLVNLFNTWLVSAKPIHYSYHLYVDFYVPSMLLQMSSLFLPASSFAWSYFTCFFFH